MIATRRPPSARRASAEETWRNAASATRPSTCAATENGGFISTTLGRTVLSRWSWMWAASYRVTGTSGKSRPSRAARVVGEFVQDEAASGEFGEDGEKARAGRRLQHEIGGRDRGGGGGGEAERDRRRELLQRLALFGAARVRGQQRRDLRQHGEKRGRQSPRARACRARTCAGTEPSPPRRRHRRSSSPRRHRRRSRQRRWSWRRARPRCRWPGRAREDRGENAPRP